MNPKTLFSRPTAPLLRVVGDELRARVEVADSDEKIDHVWITLDPGIGTRVLASVNTSSLKNRKAGFDDRIRVGKIRGSWNHLPRRGVTPCPEFDYDKLERENTVFFEHFSRAEMEVLLLETTTHADLLEVWGAPYFRKLPGLHQIHSRRASCAVPTDLKCRDGALKFYYRHDKTFLLLLFKFCGQP